MSTLSRLTLLFGAATLVACGGDKDDETDNVTDDDTFEPDTDTDADSDADADTDSDADSDTDTDTDADTDTAMPTPTGDTGAPAPVNLLSNGNFETDNGGTPPLPTDWLVFPPGLTNYATARTGEAIYGSGATFSSHEGTGAVKVYGQFTGFENETPIYQELNPVVAGDTYELTGWAYTHTDDHVQGSTIAYLSIKYFDSYFNYYGSSDSAVIDVSTPGSTWIQLTAAGTVPKGATIAQAAIQYMHCFGDVSGSCFDGGSVYFDDLSLVRTGP